MRVSSPHNQTNKRLIELRGKNEESYKFTNVLQQAFGNMKWNLVECNQQRNYWECGYYVMRWIHEFVTHQQHSFFKTFMNKVLYAREGARTIMDRTFADYLQVKVEVDGVDIEVLEAFMLKRSGEEPLGHAAAIVADVLAHAETNHVISASQKQALLHKMALKLS